MVKRTHQAAWIVFALFIAYLALVRVAITWAQFAPEQFISSVEWLTKSEVSLETLSIEQGWFGIDVEIEELLVELDGLKAEASRISFDFNLFSPLIPRARWGDVLTIQNLAILEYGEPKVDAEAGMSVERFLSLNSQNLTSNIDLSRFWRKLDVTKLSATIYEGEIVWKVSVVSLQAFKGVRWSLAADFNLHYGQVLQGERFQLKASLAPNLFGGIESGDFTVKAYDAIRLDRLVDLTSEKWREILPIGELVPGVKGEFSKSLLSRLSVELMATGLNWRSSEVGLPKSLGVNLEWQNQAKIYDGSQANWQFQLSDVQIDDRFVPTNSPVSVQLVAKRFLHVETDAFDLQPFKPIVKAVLYNESVAKLFDASAELTLKNVVADVAVPELYFENLTADIAALAIPVTDLPGLALQDMRIEKKADLVTVSTKKPIWVMYPIVHAVPMRFDFKSDLTGKFNLRNGDWVFNPLQLIWDEMPLTLTAKGDFKGKLDIHSKIEPGTVAKVNTYLPYSIMPSTLQDWLKMALVSGEQVKGQFFFKGDINDFPFESGESQFGGVAELENAVLKFDEEWPEIRNLNAKLDWSQFNLNIAADKALLAQGVEARKVDVNVGPLNGEDVAVEFSAKISVESAVAIDYLLTGPLAKALEVDDLLADKKKVDLNGAVEVALGRVWIPVSGYDDKEVQVEGAVKLARADLMLFDTLYFQEIAGLVRFNQDGVESKKITSLFQGGRSEFSAITQKGVVNIRGSGLAKVDQPSIVKGMVTWKTIAKIPIKDTQSTSRSTTTLVDLEVDGSKLDWLMPAPLDNQALQGALRTSVRFEKDSIRLEGQASDLGSFEVHINNKESQSILSKGLITLGAKKTNLAHETGLKVSGQLPLIDLDGWGYWEVPSIGEEIEAVEFLKEIEWSGAQVRFGKVKLVDHIYRDVDLSWDNAFVRGFTANVQSKQISANLVIDPQGQIAVNLDWLQIYLPINSTESDIGSEERKELLEVCKGKPVQTTAWPSITFKGKNIRVDDIGFANLTFKVEDDNQKLRLRGVRATLEKGAGAISGDYDFYKLKKLSNAAIKLTSTNVKDLTELVGLKRGFTGKRADVSSNITWVGGLECFNLQGLLGKTEYRVREGEIEDIEPGLARLLGLLNVTSLARRLSLDLKDLTAKGFVYDSIKSETHFLNGKLYLKDFKLKAPSASVSLRGDINLIDQEFNLKAAVVPALGSSLPALSALTGIATPLGALAVYAFMKVIPSLNEDFVTYRYTVTGPWQAPVIEEEEGLKRDWK